MELGLEGRAAIVTGAGRGIGRAIAEALAAEGADVLLVARGAEALDEVAAGIAAGIGGRGGRGGRSGRGGRAVAMAADVAEPGAASAVVDRCVAEFGRLDVLVNNAGGSWAKPFDQLTDQDWADGFEVNFFAAVRMASACAPVMRAAGWGRMIHLGSISGRRPDGLYAPYAAAKAALANVSVVLSNELAGDGVTSNCIVAGITETELVREQAEASAAVLGSTADAVMARVLEHSGVPAGRFGTPDEIASAVTYLASERSAWITGSTLTIDGGTLRTV